MTVVRRPILRYHGGKWILAPWIIEHFPNHHTYVEPFGGAASVLLRKRRSHSEVYNDLDDEIVNLFQVVRDRGGELVHALRYTPYSRIEFERSYMPAEDPFERARRTVVRSFMGFGSGSATCAKSRTGFRGTSVRSGSGPAGDWRNYPDALRDIVDRLRGVVIEHRDAKEVMLQHDRTNTLHYCDPPYVHATRYRGEKSDIYRHEMSEADHEELCRFLLTLKGKVILGGYDNELYNDLLTGWGKSSRMAYADGQKKREEVLWINRKEHRQLEMKF